mmetsp:Transcript_2220/g.3340  ORF Transcript_2220/g.3340 Transcript_2220/m.3340 type:complete len:241 (-) Transcript_2220:650-1372(-)
MRSPSVLLLLLFLLLLEPLEIGLLLLSELLLKVLHVVKLLLGVVHGLSDIFSAANSEVRDFDGVSSSLGCVDKHFLEFVVLLLELANELVGGTLVDDGLVLDLLGSVSVPEGGHRFFVVHVGGRDSTDHDGLGVTSQGILKDSGQIRVSVGNYGLLLSSHGFVSEDTDASSKHSQTLVDSTSLLQSLALGTGLACLFRTSQIDQVNDRELLDLATVLEIDLLELDGDDGMSTRRGLVHQG